MANQSVWPGHFEVGASDQLRVGGNKRRSGRLLFEEKAAARKWTGHEDCLSPETKKPTAWVGFFAR